MWLLGEYYSSGITRLIKSKTLLQNQALISVIIHLKTELDTHSASQPGQSSPKKEETKQGLSKVDVVLFPGLSLSYQATASPAHPSCRPLLVFNVCQLTHNGNYQKKLKGGKGGEWTGSEISFDFPKCKSKLQFRMIMTELSSSIILLWEILPV